MLIVVDLHDAIFDCDAFTGEGDNALDNILVFGARWNSARDWIFDAGSFVGANGVFVFIHEYDNLTALWDVFVASKVCPGYGGAIYDDAVVVFEGIFHTASDDVVGTIDVSVQKKCA